MASSSKTPAFRHGVVGGPATRGSVTTFRVWAPGAKKMEVTLSGGSILAMASAEEGYWEASVDAPLAGEDYRFVIDASSAWPDPASRFQPAGVHGPSRVMDLEFAWSDRDWTGPKIEEYITCELHTGTFTPEGTLAAIEEKFGHLRELGVTAVEIMPLAQFPGRRNWGYDGVYPFAVQNSYGGPRALQKLVDACHKNGLAVVLDVVYNHLGPEGNYFHKFGPYFSDRYRTPWGSAINFDGPYSDGVRRFFIENALYWISEFHIDALRLDAVHGIFDQSAYPFLEELGDEVHALGTESGRNVYLIAESNLNDPRLTQRKARGGFGLDAQWNDDFHHALRTVLTGDRSGYYRDFGTTDDVGKAYRDGFVYTGEYSEFRKRRHGRQAPDMPAGRLVAFSSNHDQVGNRMLGERLSSLVPLEEQKLAAGAVLLSPFLPLLFMGEEYGEPAPFLYFIEHSDPALIDAVRRGRKEEFESFAWHGEPPDPQAPETYEMCKLQWSLLDQEPHRTMFQYYRSLIRLRKEISPVLLRPSASKEVVVRKDIDVVDLCYTAGKSSVWLLMNFAAGIVNLAETRRPGRWTLLIDSSGAEWSGPGSLSPKVLEGPPHPEIRLQPRSILLYGDLTSE
jgi:maltooligosyltrehalose trehalohydrolase